LISEIKKKLDGKATAVDVYELRVNNNIGNS
jgi:hypothetical protein